MSSLNGSGVPEGYATSGLAHQPKQLRSNPNLLEGRDFVVIDGIAFTLTRKQAEVENVLRLVA